jgi:hypothetical protein
MIADLLIDVPTTAHDHIKVLGDGLSPRRLEVTGERRVHGAVERSSSRSSSAIASSGAGLRDSRSSA